MGTAVISCCDAAPIFEAAEHPLDEVTLFVEVDVVLDWLLAVFAAGDAGFDLSIGQCLAKPVAVIASVGDQCVRVWQCG